MKHTGFRRHWGCNQNLRNEIEMGVYVQRLRSLVLELLGLLTACHLQGLGHKVTIITDKTSPNTTSDVAAAFWLPYKAAPIEKVHIWAEDTYNHLKKNVELVKGLSKF